jgi:hypothetical protein
MYLVTRVDPLSWAKNYALATLAVVTLIAVLAGLPFLAVGLASVADEGADVLPVLAIAAGAALAWLLAITVIVFFVSLLQGLAFNWALGRTGGLRLDLALGHTLALEAPAVATSGTLVEPVSEPPDLPPPAHPVD